MANSMKLGAQSPKVVLIGDSIRMGYQRATAARLAGRAAVVGPAENCEDTAQILRHLDVWVISREAELVHFNAGLHDLKVSRQDGSYQVPPLDYRRNLECIVRRVQTETDASLVFATTTPVLERLHSGRTGIDFDRRQDDVEEYNAIALAVMREAGVLIDDLHRFVQENDPERLMDLDGTHYTPAGYEKLAEAVTAAVGAALDERNHAL